MSEIILRTEVRRTALIEFAPESEAAYKFRQLTLTILENDKKRIPETLSA